MEHLESRQKANWKTALYIAGTIILFVFALDLMISAFQHLSTSTAATILLATSNPFTALFIGLLITAMIQSSSTTTSLAVALVASGAIQMEAAVPIIMGANVGTTITSTIVSLGFINKKKEFKRAVTIGAYHDIFNILTVLILFPLEYKYGFLSQLATTITTNFFNASTTVSPGGFQGLWSGFDPIINFLLETVQSGLLITLLSFALLFISILIFRRLISRLLMAGSPHHVGSFFFKNSPKAFFWGVVTTAAIRSSTITTSLVVPIVAQRIVKMRQAVPFILGANLGTTITALMAAIFSSSGQNTISVAIIHLLLNVIGVLIWYPIPYLRRVPIDLAGWLGSLTLKYRLAGLVYILLLFFFLPFSLIYLNKSSVEVFEAEFKRTNHRSGEESTYRIVTKTQSHNDAREWLIYNNDDQDPSLVVKVYQRDNILLVDQQMFMFYKIGYCWEGEISGMRNQTCVESIIPNYSIGASLTFDSVYVFRKQLVNNNDTTVTRFYIGQQYPLILREETLVNGSPRTSEQIISLKKH